MQKEKKMWKKEEEGIKLISFLSYYATSLEVTFSGKYYILKILTKNMHRMIYLNKGSSSSRAISKCIFHIIQNV